jgi:hypothetical protein
MFGVLAALVVGALAGCGSGGGNDSITQPPIATDTAAPTVTISFPLQGSYTDATAIIVRGRAADATGIDAISVNGIAVTTTDGFRNWSAVVPLPQAGPTALTVSARDTLGNATSSAATATVRRGQPFLSWIRGMDYDASGDRIVVADRLTHAIYGFDAVSGAAQVISSDAAAGAAGADFGQPCHRHRDRDHARYILRDVDRRCAGRGAGCRHQSSALDQPGTGRHTDRSTQGNRPCFRHDHDTR